MIEMKVTGLTIDPLTDMPIIILKDLAGKHAIPIWIGLIEASAIATELEKIRLARPMTHDLMCDAIDKLGGKVARVEVIDLRDNTFFARVCVDTGARGIVELDSRPSDAIALALRSGSRILVAPEVLARVERIQVTERPSAAGQSAGVERPGDGEVAGDLEGRRARRARRVPTGPTPIALPKLETRRPSRRRSDDATCDPAEIYRALLESLSDEDFGKWKM